MKSEWENIKLPSKEDLEYFNELATALYNTNTLILLPIFFIIVWFHKKIISFVLWIFGFKTKVQVDDTAKLLAEASKNLSELLIKKETELAEHKETIKNLNNALKSLSEQKDLPDSKNRIDKALRQASTGDTVDAENLFLEAAENKKADKFETSLVYFHVGVLAFLHDIDKAIRSFQNSVRFNPNNADALNMLGRCFLRIGRYDLALDIFCKAIRINYREKDKLSKYQNIGNIGLIFMQLNNNTKAEKIFLRVLRYYLNNPDDYGFASTHGNLGIVYKNLGKYDESIQEHKKSQNYNKKVGNLLGLATTHSNIGVVYDLQGEIERSEKEYKEAFKILEKINDQEGWARTLINLSIIQKQKNEPLHFKAKETLGNALNIAEINGLHDLKALCHANFADIEMDLKNYKESLNHCEVALKISKNIGYKYLETEMLKRKEFLLTKTT